MNTRIPDYPIADFLLNRWSPRAMSGESITHQELMSLFEAARWAPSSSNSQPWNFIYAHRESPYWDPLFNLLVDFNKQWTKNAAVLMVIFSRDTFPWNDKPSVTHSFDTGAAWENLALQAEIMNLIAHGMAGFDYARAKSELSIPSGYTVEAMIAIGKPGKVEDLPKEMQEREKMSDRKKITEFIFEGSFKK